MKAGWEVRPLGEMLSLEYGKPLPETERNSDGAYPVYGANGVKDYSNRYYEEGPSIIIGRKGSAGEVTFVSRPFWPLDVTYFVRHDSTRTDLHYLDYWLKAAELPRFARGVKPGINRNEVYALPFTIPPLEEQHRIVAVLDEVHDGLARTRANIEANLVDAQAFGDSIVNSMFKAIEPESEMLRLDEVARDFGRGKSKHRPRNDPALYGGAYPFIQTGDVRNSDRIITEFSQTYNEQGLRQSKLWPAGTVCITIAANIAESATLGFDACFPDSIIGVVPDADSASSTYIEYTLQAAKIRLKARGKGAAQDNINLGTFETERFPFPSRTRQDDVVMQLDTTKAELGRAEGNWWRQLADLDALQQSLYAKAFRGELT